MTSGWRAVVAALDPNDTFRSKVSVYRHPLAGRPILWHVVRALHETVPAPDSIRVVHAAGIALQLDDVPESVTYEAIADGDAERALRAAVTRPGPTVLIDGAAPLVTPGTIARVLRFAEQGVAALVGEQDHAPRLLVAAEGPALASAEDPRRPRGAARVEAAHANEALRVIDRHTLATAGCAMRDRLVRRHEDAGVSFILPDTSWVDVDVRIGRDTVIYPGAVLEGMTEIGAECVIGPYSRLVDAQVGRGVELRGWNYVTRTSVRNHAVLEPYVRRGVD